MDIKAEISDKLDKPIALVGMMGCGKSHVGQILSNMLGCPVYDSDEIIEQLEGMAVSKIFETKGESYFRKIEAETILKLLESRTPSVIATGGGAVINPTVLNAIKEYAVSMWLMTDIDVILKRVEGDVRRPLLNVPDKAARLTELLRVRRPLYAQADIKLDSNTNDPDALKDRLGRALYEYLNLR